MNRDFSAVLSAIRASDEQMELEQHNINMRWKSLGTSLVFGLLIACLVTAYFLDARWWIMLALVFGAGLALVGWDKQATSAIQIGKEQDRRYFLACLRGAQNIDELNQAGFFSYLPASVGPEFVAHTKREVERLQHVLNVEPEWFGEI